LLMDDPALIKSAILSNTPTKFAEVEDGRDWAEVCPRVVGRH
jgi:hypothetical protein